jgi:hypothetical protein
MSNFTKEELQKIGNEWKAIRESEKRIDYEKYRNPKIKTRWHMLKRADDVSYRERNKRHRAILNMFKDEIRKDLDAYANRPKILDESGKLIFLDEKGENHE